MDDQQFLNKYRASKKKYAKRVKKYGDPYKNRKKIARDRIVKTVGTTVGTTLAIYGSYKLSKVAIKKGSDIYYKTHDLVTKSGNIILSPNHYSVIKDTTKMLKK